MRPAFVLLRRFFLPTPLKVDKRLHDHSKSGSSSIAVRRAPLSKTLDPVFESYHVSETICLTLKVSGTSIAIFINQLGTFDTELLKLKRVIRDDHPLSTADKQNFAIADRSNPY